MLFETPILSAKYPSLRIKNVYVFADKNVQKIFCKYNWIFTHQTVQVQHHVNIQEGENFRTTILQNKKHTKCRLFLCICAFCLPRRQKNYVVLESKIIASEACIESKSLCWRLLPYFVILKHGCCYLHYQGNYLHNRKSLFVLHFYSPKLQNRNVA